MKKSKTQRFSEVFREMLRQEPEMKTQMLAQNIADALPEVLGSYYQFVDKITLADNILYIYVKSPAAKQAFAQNAGMLRDQINKQVFMQEVKLREVRIL